MESAILRELAGLLLRRKAKDERLGLVSLTRAHLASDLSTLRVSVSLFGERKENNLTWKALRAHSVWFQSELARNLRLRLTPTLTFEIDTSIAEGDRILNLIDAKHEEQES
ncbi:MAG: 30S ribosome-binding factor RbfA [Leptospirales bacterium]|nr:30S ribosome-binding factor RbfA [Leptospirales bacterium]